MPTYEYYSRCCDTFFEKYQSFSEDKLTQCPHCQECGLVDRLISNPEFVFIKGDINTVGQQAAANNAKYGKYWAEDRALHEKQEYQKRLDRKREKFEEQTGKTSMRPKAGSSTYTPPKVNLDDPKAVNDYVYEGKTS